MFISAYSHHGIRVLRAHAESLREGESTLGPSYGAG
jgi:hypothetical protein